MKTDPGIEAIIRLTGQQDQAALLSCLIDILHHTLPSAKTSYFELLNTANDLEFNSSNARSAMLRNPRDEESELLGLVGLPGCLEAVETREVVTEDDDGVSRRTIMPILGSRYVTALLVIDNDRSRPEQEIYVKALVRIFGSLALLLRQKERDTLTALLNRHAMETRVNKLLDQVGNTKRANDKDTRMCLAMIDIDQFKAVNDQFGHLFGDEVLTHFARLMSSSFRFDDVLCRYGGEEFIAVLRNVGLDNALPVLERFRKRVENYDFPQVGTKTTSIGVVEIKQREVLPTLIDRADKALYFAKHHGRNQVQAYDQLVAGGQLK